MTFSRVVAPLAVALAVLPAQAQVFVDDDFESYADTAAMQDVWVPIIGNSTDDGTSTSISSIAELLPDTGSTNFTGPTAELNGLTDFGNALGRGTTGGVSDFQVAPGDSGFDLEPSETQNVVVRGDVFVDEGLSNWRQTIGLRNDTFDTSPDFGVTTGLNILEMGFWNAGTCDPTVVGCNPSGAIDENTPGFIEDAQFGYRLVLFGFGVLGAEYVVNGVSRGPLEAIPNYQYFELDPALDLEENGGNADGAANIADVGTGFHTFEATIGEDSVSLTLDLFANGVNEISDAEGVDATIEILGITGGIGTNPDDPSDIAGFTSLRLGGPSGVTGNEIAAFDNIYLALEDITVDPPFLLGDADGDGDVDGDDLIAVQTEFGSTGTAPLLGDADGDGDVDGDDLIAVQTEFGNVAPGVAVPEPAAAMLFAIGLTGLVCRGRRC